MSQDPTCEKRIDVFEVVLLETCSSTRRISEDDGYSDSRTRPWVWTKAGEAHLPLGPGCVWGC